MLSNREFLPKSVDLCGKRQFYYVSKIFMNKVLLSCEILEKVYCRRKAKIDCVICLFAKLDYGERLSLTY